MNVTPLAISDALLIEPKVFDDGRGFFFESFRGGSAQLDRILVFLSDFSAG